MNRRSAKPAPRVRHRPGVPEPEVVALDREKMVAVIFIPSPLVTQEVQMFQVAQVVSMISTARGSDAFTADLAGIRYTFARARATTSAPWRQALVGRAPV